MGSIEDQLGREFKKELLSQSLKPGDVFLGTFDGIDHNWCT